MNIFVISGVKYFWMDRGYKREELSKEGNYGIGKVLLYLLVYKWFVESNEITFL